MRVLFLDDMNERHELAGQIAAAVGLEMDHAFTAEAAIRLLEREEYAGACLDHDLADDHYSGPYVSPAQGGTAHSGRAVARWIAEHGRPGTVLVHSFNPDGASAICNILGPSGVAVTRAPFGPSSFARWVASVSR